MPEHYKLVTFKHFPGDLEELVIDPKHRVSFPSKDWKTLVESNRLHLLNASRGIPPFTYKHPAMYLGQNVVAVLEPGDYAETRKERDLVELANGETVDIYEINHELHARTTKIGGKTFLVAYPLFDWLMYYSKVTKGLNDKDKLKWAIDNNYTIIKIDDNGRMVFTRFLDTLELSDKLGIKGVGPAVAMGNP
ncbi:MAG: hypothetical protein Q8R04_03210, partial [Nanoarchaeota archaeon]|nr:hypothetical protein [Nanoarchaeota archaeon]